MAAVRTTRAALPEMIRRGGGSIVTISSVNAYLPDPLVIDYSAAKAALTNFCKSLSKELGTGRYPGQHDQPRTGGDCDSGWATTAWPRPSPTRPVPTRQRLPPKPPRARSLAGSPVPRRSPTSPSCLASDRTGNVTGSDFAIDGGLVQTL